MNLVKIDDEYINIDKIIKIKEIECNHNDRVDVCIALMNDQRVFTKKSIKEVINIIKQGEK